MPCFTQARIDTHERSKADPNIASNTDNDSRPTILITGAGGFLGTQLAHALGDDYRIVGFDVKEGADTIACDLTDQGSIDAALTRVHDEYGARLASVIHLAAYYAFSDEPHPLYQKLNVDGTRMLLEALNRRFEVEQFLYASTMLVHAPTEPGMAIDEDSPIDPTWAYPRSKWAAEEAIREHRGAIPAAILRLAGAYTDDCGSPTLAHQIQRIYEQSPTGHLYAGGLDRGQAFLFIDDLVAAVRAAVDRRRELPDDFCALVGEPEVMTYRALQNLIAEKLGEDDWQTFRAPAAVAKLGARLMQVGERVVPDSIDKGEEPFIQPFMIDRANDHFELDIRRAREHLGWHPEHHLRDHVPIMIDHLQEDPVGFYKANKLATPVWLDELAERSTDPAGRVARVRARHDRQHHQNRWSYLLIGALGAWLLLDGFAWGERSTPMIWSTTLSGIAIIVLAALAHRTGAAVFRWATALVGLWAAFAPLALWSENAAGYLAGTLIGGLVGGLALALPPEPGVGVNAELERRELPNGWSYNPSVWAQRAAIVGLAFVGLFISRYLGAYQLEQTAAAWDPFFGSGTERIITSDVSRAWPVPDAALGGFVYLLEILTGVVGGRARWRTMPWLVLTFGILIVPLGAVSIYFIIIQPVVIGTWCTLCLIAAVAMIAQIPLSLDEIVASLQFLRERVRAGRPLLWVLFRGDDYGGKALLPTGKHPPSGEQGVRLYWPLLLSIGVGAGLMAVRMLAQPSPLTDANHVIGALVITVAATALSEVGRAVRLVNVLLGAALLAAPFMFEGGGMWLTVLDIAAGLALIALSIPRGDIRGRYGRWMRYIF